MAWRYTGVTLTYDGSVTGAYMGYYISVGQQDQVLMACMFNMWIWDKIPPCCNTYMGYYVSIAWKTKF